MLNSLLLGTVGQDGGYKETLWGDTSTRWVKKLDQDNTTVFITVTIIIRACKGILQYLKKIQN